MNVNFGLFPPIEGARTKKADRKKLYTDAGADRPGGLAGLVPPPRFWRRWSPLGGDHAGADRPGGLAGLVAAAPVLAPAVAAWRLQSQFWRRAAVRRGRGAVVANSARFSARSRLPSAVANRSSVRAAHSSKLRRPS